MPGLFARLSQRTLLPQSVPRPALRGFGTEQKAADPIDRVQQPHMPESAPPIPPDSPPEISQQPASHPSGNPVKVESASRVPQQNVEIETHDALRQELHVAVPQADASLEVRPRAAVLPIESARRVLESMPEASMPAIRAAPTNAAPRSPELESERMTLRMHSMMKGPDRRSFATEEQPAREAAPIVNVTIDRVEVQVPPTERPTAVQERRASPTRMSLDDYLARSSRG